LKQKQLAGRNVGQFPGGSQTARIHKHPRRKRKPKLGLQLAQKPTAPPIQSVYPTQLRKQLAMLVPSALLEQHQADD
jgi:hypothetical protein